MGRKAVHPRPLLTFLLGEEAVSPRQLLIFLLGKAAILPWQLLTFLPGKEAAHPRQAVRQELSFPIGKEAVLPRQLLTFLLGKEAIIHQQLLTLLPEKVTVPPRQPLIFPQGKEVETPSQVNQAIKVGQAGGALGILPGIGHPRLPRRIVLSPMKTTPPLPSPVGFPKGLLMKNLTLSESLTYPTNL